MYPAIQRNRDKNRNEGNNGLASLADRRRRWVDVTKENDFEDGIKRLLTQLYPDTAHFIYELLQNAEDACATEVRFVLAEDHLTFEHDGSRLFSLKDVDRITSIGKTAQKDDPTKIGKFGIGFKAVYSYTCTPEIRSGRYRFRIVDMVVPETIENDTEESADNKYQTNFFFPFDNREKLPDRALGEIEQSLRGLEDVTLLFLKNIRKIVYQLPDSTKGSMKCVPRCDDPNRVSIVVDHGSRHVSHHYLRFDRDVDITDEDGKGSTCRISAAFGLELPVDSDWRIVPLSPGRVCIYFPAVKETSNLRFHVHAPFASTVARDSVRECGANEELRDRLAVLIAESMLDIQRRGQLTVSFLSVLPTESDSVPDYYRPIMERLIDAFTKQPLLPMKRGSHAAASGVYRAEGRGLSDLIEDHDLAFLLAEDRSRHLWIANPPQRYQGADRFLEMLKITAWGVEDLIKCLSVVTDKLELWMKKKPHEWHQRMYALLYEQSHLRRFRFILQPAFSELRLILCADGAYRAGRECYFPESDSHGDEDFPRVDRRVYSSGVNEREQKAARSFLESAGVRGVDDVVRVETVLERRYAVSDVAIADGTIKQDIKAFMRLVKKDPTQAGMFKDFFVLEAEDSHNVLSRCKPSQVFIDEPYEATGLGAYHDDSNISLQYRKLRLSERYRQIGVDPRRLVDFADAVGAQYRLKAECQEIPSSHPEYNNLRGAPGNYTYTGTDRDYKIKEFHVLLELIQLDKAKLIWRTMCEIDPSCLKACLRKNRSQEARYAASTLVHELRNAQWVPQEYSERMSFVEPRGASRQLLPGGLRFDPNDAWIKAIEFGKTADDRSARARREGFDDYDEKQQMVKIAQLLRARGVQPDEAFQHLSREYDGPVPDGSAGIGGSWRFGSERNGYATANEPRAVLLAISKWWDRNKNMRRSEYDRLLYPQDFDPARLQDEPIDRFAWLTLFALAAFNTLGRTQDAQHRTFIEQGCRAGWWQEFAESKPPDDVKPWLDRLHAWSGVKQVEEYQLWRRAFVDLYTIVRWLDEYAVVMRKLPRIAAERGGDPVSLHDVLRPGQSPLLRELGIEAAPLDRTLGIGINWMIRELLRKGTYDEGDEAVMAPYCWMPSLRVRERLLARLRFDHISDNADSEDSRHVHRFLVEQVGCDRARFYGDYDLPLQLITTKEHTEALNRCFGDGMIGQ